MHRIDTSGHVLNRFSTGNPAIGQLATRLGADWPNDVQENICYVIEQVGVALVKGDHTQLYDAILALIIANGGGGPGGPGVPIDRIVNAAGLAVGGGALATDITITVPKASSADVAAGIDDTKAVTPAALAAAVVRSMSTTGYLKRIDGMIEMWGVGTAIANSTTIINLPNTFPNACLFGGIESGKTDFDQQDNNPFVSGRGVNTLSVFSAVGSNVALNYFAIGH